MHSFTDFALFREFFAHLALLPGSSVAAFAEAFAEALAVADCAALSLHTQRFEGDRVAALLAQLVERRADAAAVADAISAAGAVPALLECPGQRLALAVAERSAAARAAVVPQLELSALLRFVRAGDADAEAAVTAALQRFSAGGPREDCADALREFVAEALPGWLWEAAVANFFTGGG
jgi:hypothetical protein